ncbi:MAG: ABC transporter substrate-binding protein [Acidaminococcaceae bacterium]|nr:ABC transporter substrate-binding protein [Acidaminococcaceae bacterium]MDD4721605.1 ABC transporter substrate-binding protein [Acidaminococcaceae bacterium]
MQKYFHKFLVMWLILIVCAIYFFMERAAPQIQSEQNVRIVIDSVGREIVIPEHPKRVVILNASNLELYYAAGGQAIAKPVSSAFDVELQKKIADIPEIGFIHSPNLEKIISLQPDLVIGTNVPFHNALKDALQKAGIPLYINSLSSYEDVLKTITFYGELANTKDRAIEKRRDIETEYAAVINQVKGKKTPKSLIVFGSPDSYSMATKKSFSGDLVNRLGGGNIADLNNNFGDSYVPLSMEYITQKDPEVIFIITMGNSQKVMENFKTNMKENPIWNDVSAVKNDRIYQLPADLFTVNPGTQVAKAMLLLAEYLYPEEGKYDNKAG